MRALLLPALLLSIPANASTVVPPEIISCWWAQGHTLVSYRVALLEGSIERKIRTLTTFPVGTQEIQFTKTEAPLRFTGVRVTCKLKTPIGQGTFTTLQEWSTHIETSNTGDVIRMKIIIHEDRVDIPQ